MTEGAKRKPREIR
jgi:hypothetical protein